MASLANDPGGRRRILFVDTEGNRKAIRLGKMSKRQAEAVKLRIEDLATAKLSGGSPSDETARWVAEISDDLADKLTHHGLIEPRNTPASITLGQHMANYFSVRTDVKHGTQLNWGHSKRCLIEFFGAKQAIDSITVGDAKDFERWLGTAAARNNRHGENDANSGLAPNTIRKRISNAKQFFEDAVQREQLDRNPFASLKGAVGSNRERDFFITRKMAALVLEACPDSQWRLLFALSRYAGLRCPSETLSLQWADVQLAESRMLVRSSKTEHYEGKGSRVVPIFPELRPYLEQAWDEAEPGTQFVITRYRGCNQNLRTQLQRIIAKAGLETWPKLFANLRASRATELASEHPGHVAAAWLGHSTVIANKHYWQVTEADFEAATGVASSVDEASSKTTPAKAAQNAAQSVRAEGSLTLQGKNHQVKKTLELQRAADLCDPLQLQLVGDTGFEPVTSAV